MTADPLKNQSVNTSIEPLPSPAAPAGGAPLLDLASPSPKLPCQPRDMEPEGFTQWWAAYPRKVGKDAARKAYAAALKRAATADLLAGLKRARFSADPQFIPHPSTWLNAGRWQDEAGGTSAPASATPVAAPEHPLWPLLSGRLNPTEFRHWIAPLRVTGEDEDCIHLAAPSPFHAAHARQNYDLALRAALGKRVVIVHATTGEGSPS